MTLRHGGVVVSTDASQQEGPGFKSGYSSFLPESTTCSEVGNSEFVIAVNVSVLISLC